MDSQKSEFDFEYQNSQYGSIDNSKPLIYQKSYTSSIQSQPFSKVKYESLNEIHLDFSKATFFKDGHKSVGSNGSINNINGSKNSILSSLSESLKQKTKSISSNLPAINTDINSLNKSKTSHTPSTDSTIDLPFHNKNLPISIDTPLSAVNLFKSILSPISKNQNDFQERDISFDYQNGFVDSFVDDQKDDTLAENINPNISILSSSSFDSKSQTSNFRSFKTFERLRDQLAQEQIKNETQTRHLRENIIHNQFSEQFRNEFTHKAPSIKRENAFLISSGKNDPFNPNIFSNAKTSQEDDANNNENHFLSSESNGHHRNKPLKFNWAIQTESEKYISKLESKIKKIKKAPKEIIVEIPDDDFDNYAYDSVTEESELLSDSDSINQPLISRSDAGKKLRRRKYIIQTLRDNKNLIIVIILALLLAVIVFLFL